MRRLMQCTWVHLLKPGKDFKRVPFIEEEEILSVEDEQTRTIEVNLEKEIDPRIQDMVDIIPDQGMTIIQHVEDRII